MRFDMEENDNREEVHVVDNGYNWIQDLIKNASDSVKQFIVSKYSHDKTGLWIHIGVVFILSATIIILAIVTKLDNSIVGTLLGSLIGFSFSNFPNRKGGSKE